MKFISYCKRVWKNVVKDFRGTPEKPRVTICVEVLIDPHWTPSCPGTSRYFEAFVRRDGRLPARAQRFHGRTQEEAIGQLIASYGRVLGIHLDYLEAPGKGSTPAWLVNLQGAQNSLPRCAA